MSAFDQMKAEILKIKSGSTIEEFKSAVNAIEKILTEMSPSVAQTVQSELEGHSETALWKYAQLKFAESNLSPDDKRHWMDALRAALKLFISSNNHSDMKRDFVFYLPKLRKIFNSQWENGVLFASDHLNISEEELKNVVPQPTLEEVFQFAGMALPAKWKESKYL